MSTTDSNLSVSPHIDLEVAVKQEYEHLSRVHPDPKDIPGCWSLFSRYIECVGVKGQVKAIYRYGGMADCSQKMQDVRFCMSLKMLGPEERREAWLMHRARWWAERRTNGSSEDVWDMRSEPIKNFPPAPVQFIFDREKNEFTVIQNKS